MRKVAYLTDARLTRIMNVAAKLERTNGVTYLGTEGGAHWRVNTPDAEAAMRRAGAKIA
jgi:hypothetical protein